jgi:hypothetical protein
MSLMEAEKKIWTEVKAIIAPLEQAVCEDRAADLPPLEMDGCDMRTYRGILKWAFLEQCRRRRQFIEENKIVLHELKGEEKDRAEIFNIYETLVRLLYFPPEENAPLEPLIMNGCNMRSLLGIARWRLEETERRRVIRKS